MVPRPPCAEWWCEMENRSTTSFGYSSSMASLPVWPHCANARRIRCQVDLNSFPLGELEETTGTPPYYVDEDYPAGPEINGRLPEQSNWRGSESSTLEIDLYVWCYTLLVVHARNDEWMNERLAWPHIEIENNCIFKTSVKKLYIQCGTL